MRKFLGGAEKGREKTRQELQLQQLLLKTPKLDLIWGQQPYNQQQVELIDSASELPLTSDADLSETFVLEIVSQNEITSSDFMTALSSDQFTPSMFQDLGLLVNRLLPKCNDRKKKLKGPFSLRKLTNFTRKLANFCTFLKLKLL